ncbi:MAG: DUF1189 family protein [Lachnospiraceae bacterium]|nr:DUF1189 family protein [Lachnospiraceae bacterium]
MDNNYNQQPNGSPYQQQGNPYQQQGNFYQQRAPYMGGGPGNYGGNAEPRKAPNIFQQFVLSFVPTKYDRLMKVKVGSMVLFVTLLAFAATVISFINHMISLKFIDVNALVDRLPDFTITDGDLEIEEDFLYEDGDMYVYITKDVAEFTYGDAAKKAAEGYRDIILVGRNQIYFMQNREQLRYQSVGFKIFGRNKQLSKKRALDAVMPYLMAESVVLYIFIFLGRIFGYFLFAAVYLLFAMLIASIMKKRLETGVLFRTAVYAKVLMFVAAMILGLIPFMNAFVFFLLRVVVTISFMVFAIAKLPENKPVPMPMGPGMGIGPGQGWQ